MIIRKIKTLLVVALALLMVSCSKNSEEKTSEEPQKVDSTRTSIDAEDSLRQVPDSLIIQAEKNNAEAQFLLGRRYWNLDDTINCLKWMRMADANGDEMAKVFLLEYNNDYKRALPILIRLAKGGNPIAQCHLGECYERGKGVVKSDKKAEEWYLKAAKQGDVSAKKALVHFYHLLAIRYEDGLGVEQSYEEAEKCFIKTAELGDVSAKRDLIVFYKRIGRGYSEEQSYEEAEKWYLKAAEQGDAFDQFDLGWRYYYGEGVKQSFEKAVEWYSKAAEQGWVFAKSNLGLCYYRGEGVEQSFEKAAEWWSNAAEQGDEYAQRCLGDCYYGGRGVEQSYENAVVWWSKAAEQGDALAQSSLGDCYYYGEGVKRWRKGLKYSYKKAVEWYSKAAEQGCVHAKFQLGRCYQYGFGVNEDKLVALNYYVQASILGDKEAENRIAKLIDGELARKILLAYNEEKDLGFISTEECEKRKECIRKHYSENDFFYNINTSNKDKSLIILGLLVLSLIGQIIIMIKIYESHKHL